MAEITSGTVYATPLNDLWIGTIQLAPTADDGDEINLSTLISTKIKEVVWASSIKDATSSGSVDNAGVSWQTGTSKIVLGRSGTFVAGVTDSSRASISNFRRDIFFVARSQQG